MTSGPLRRAIISDGPYNSVCYKSGGRCEFVNTFVNPQQKRFPTDGTAKKVKFKTDSSLETAFRKEIAGHFLG